MFAIYNNPDVDFKGTNNDLYALKDVARVNKTYLNPDEQTFDNLIKHQNNEKQHNDSINEALNSYKKMAKIDTSEMIFHVKDIMTKDCVYIDSISTIQEVYDVMEEFKIKQLPIATFGKKILGMIDKEIILNLLMNDIENSKNILEKKIEDIYIPQLITADPITDIRRVAKVMVDFKLHAVPIVDENDILIGIVSKTDIIKAISHIPHLQLWS
ncbi:CBS domain-containing protein [Arcobacter venerupis]|uniref:CBS domain-containing protein n=1 Tax=Arcobacter venerupis TaxID=1054033 RepID=A0AAE7E349_9BACT|nr:CBS domain-containing protein [Arcobacter venerupis]QKF66430.1 CBS domain-containing protein [Arcobacter venerupis]RWS50792.1 CBS domain-containing protein [Arcobacter venerupis]